MESDIRKEKIDELSNSLSYVMTQGSMELFHTNFWAGLIRKYPVFAKAFIGDDYSELKSKDNGVTREYKLSQTSKDKDDDSVDYGKGKKSIDILFELSGDRAIVLENKFKSVPTKQQLCMYYDLLPSKMKFYKGILCAPFKTDIVNEDTKLVLLPGNRKGNRENYYFLDYKTIIASFRKIADEEKVKLESFDYELVKSYCDDTENVLWILRDMYQGDNAKDIYRLYFDPEIEKIGLNDICSKLSADRFMSYFKKRCLKEDEDLFNSLSMSMGFSNKKAVLDFRFDTRELSNDRTNDHYFSIGIQIEGEQFRRLFEMRKSISSPEQEVNDFAIKYKWFGEKKKGGKIIWDSVHYETGMTKKYCKYSGDYDGVYSTSDVEGKERQYMFLYQWKRLFKANDVENNGISFEELYEQLKQNLLIAKQKYDEIYKDNKY